MVCQRVGEEPANAEFVWIAGSYNFAKEIPIFADYEIHISIGGFEEKWVSTDNEGLNCCSVD